MHEEQSSNKTFTSGSSVGKEELYLHSFTNLALHIAFPRPSIRFVQGPKIDHHSVLVETSLRNHDGSSAR